MIFNYEKLGYHNLMFDGVKLSDSFVVRSFDMPWLPTINENTIEIDGKPGAWYAGRNIGTRDVTVGLGILNETRDKEEIIEMWIRLSSKLNKEEVCKLEFGHGYYVNAVLVGDTPTTTKGKWSITTATFRCFDPYIYGKDHSEPLTAGKNTFKIAGNAKAFPRFEIQGSTDVLLVNDDTGDRIHVPNLQSGSKLVIDMEHYFCKVGDIYKAADPSVSDFWPVSGDVTLSLNAGSGVMTYKEAYL